MMMFKGERLWSATLTAAMIEADDGRVEDSAAVRPLTGILIALAISGPRWAGIVAAIATVF